MAESTRNSFEDFFNWLTEPPKPKRCETKKELAGWFKEFAFACWAARKGAKPNG